MLAPNIDGVRSSRPPAYRTGTRDSVYILHPVGAARLSGPLVIWKQMTAAALAHSIVRTLRTAGHQAWLVGGCVRDLLLGCDPKDYDVATDARRRRCWNCFPAPAGGRAFRCGACARRGREGGGRHLPQRPFLQRRPPPRTVRLRDRSAPGCRSPRFYDQRAPLDPLPARCWTSSAAAPILSAASCAPSAIRRSASGGPPAAAARRALCRPPRLQIEPVTLGQSDPARSCSRRVGRADARRAGAHPHRGRRAARFRTAGPDGPAGASCFPKWRR